MIVTAATAAITAADTTVAFTAAATATVKTAAAATVAITAMPTATVAIAAAAAAANSGGGTHLLCHSCVFPGVQVLPP
jgi:hypothetical protein